jgi:hypothetical protein
MSGGDWPAVNALLVHDGDLIAGGAFTVAGATAADRIARWDGGAWHALGSGVDDWVWALGEYNGDLIAGGYFTHTGIETTDYVAAWNGAVWNPLGEGVNSGVRSLAAYDGDLYVGGDFVAAGGRPSYHIARWGAAISCAGDCVDPGLTAGGELKLRSRNPCRSPVQLTFSLPRAAPVRLTVHDLTGRRVATPFAGTAAVGEHTYSWQAGDGPRGCPAGVYFARLEVAGSVITRKLVLRR